MDKGKLEAFLTQTFISYGLNVLAGIAILLIGWHIAAWAGRFTRRRLQRREDVDPTYIPVAENLVRYAILALAIVAVLDQFGVEIASIIAVLGAIGIAVALAVQGTLANLAAGIMILLLRPIRVGDWVEADGNAGRVDLVGLFLTYMVTREGIVVSVPNSLIWTRSTRNHSRDREKQITVELKLSGADQVEAAIALVRENLAADPRILADPPVQTDVADATADTATLTVRAWCRTETPAVLAWALGEELRATLRGHGLAPAEPSDADPEKPEADPSSADPAAARRPGRAQQPGPPATRRKKPDGRRAKR